VSGGGIGQPVLGVRALGTAVKAEKAQELMRLVGDVGRVQARGGTQAALEGLKVAQGPRDMSRIARLAANKGGKTRAILKLAGRAAILLTIGTFNLVMWVFWAALTVFGFAASLKRMAERATERYCARLKLRLARARERPEREENRQGRERYAREQRLAVLAIPAKEPAITYPAAPTLAAKLARIEPFDLRRPPWPKLAVANRRGFESDCERLEKAVASLRAACA